MGGATTETKYNSFKEIEALVNTNKCSGIFFHYVLKLRSGNLLNPAFVQPQVTSLDAEMILEHFTASLMQEVEIWDHDDS